MVVANRLPVSVSKKPDGGYKYGTSPGGLVTALSALQSEYKTLWIGWPGVVDPELVDTETIEKDLLEQHRAIPIFLDRKQIHRYYHGFSNSVLWPVLHYFPDYTLYKEHDYLAYKEVNFLFANKVVEVLQDDDPSDTLVWVQDYQLMLVPALLRTLLPKLRIGFFLHTPFPSSEMFRTLPYREELLKGLLGSDLIGFHTFNYQRHFSSSVLHLLGQEVEFSRIKLDTHTLHMSTFPIGIDSQKIRELIQNPSEEFKQGKQIVKNIVQDRRMILCVDRLDYTKGIPNRLRAYHGFLQRNPELSDKVVLIQIAVPSRTEIKDYQELKYVVDDIVSQIEENFEYRKLSPIHFIYRSFPFERLAAFYQLADIALITPYFDGMNLVAKEYVAVKKDHGTLILSERAGAAYELGEALLVNPWNPDQISWAIQAALETKEEIQTQRMRAMYEKVSRNDVHYWSNSFLTDLCDIEKEEKPEDTLLISEDIQKEIIVSWRKASKRLLLLDYDGTLAQIKNLPSEAYPDERLLQLLEKLSLLPDTEIAIVTGRTTKEILHWLGHLNLIFSTEHGLYIKWLQEKDWHRTVLPKAIHSWYQEVQEVLSHYSRTTPGSHMEAKEASLVWHYRMVEPTLGKWKANELKIHLQNALANHPLEVVSGKKVVEIRSQEINKGNIFNRAEELNRSYGFVMAIGDDTTDEAMFNSMPRFGIGVKVGKTKTRAQYRLPTVTEVRGLLWKLVNAG